MALIEVPTAMVPGQAGYEQAAGGPTVCDIGPESRDVPPGGVVNVSITPVSAAAGGPVQPDRFGRFMHCLWHFARPRITRGKRRSVLGQYNPPNTKPQDPMMVETDPGSYWIGTPASLFFVGGNAGDKYDVVISYSTPKDAAERMHGVPLPSGQLLQLLQLQQEPSFAFGLTSLFVGSPLSPFTAFPPAPPFHTDFYVVQGTAQVVLPAGAIDLSVSYGPAASIPLNGGHIEYKFGIFRTTGAV